MTTERDDQQSNPTETSSHSQQPTGQQSQQPTGQNQAEQPNSDSQPTASDSEAGGQAATGQSQGQSQSQSQGQGQGSATMTQQSSTTGDADSAKATGEESSQPTGGFVGSESKDDSGYLQEKGESDSDIEGTSDKSQLDGQ